MLHNLCILTQWYDLYYIEPVLGEFWNVNWSITEYLLNQPTKSLSDNNFRMIIGQSVIITGHFSDLSCSKNRRYRAETPDFSEL